MNLWIGSESYTVYFKKNKSFRHSEKRLRPIAAIKVSPPHLARRVRPRPCLHWIRAWAGTEGRLPLHCASRLKTCFLPDILQHSACLGPASCPRTQHVGRAGKKTIAALNTRRPNEQSLCSYTHDWYMYFTGEWVKTLRLCKQLQTPFCIFPFRATLLLKLHNSHVFAPMFLNQI